MRANYVTNSVFKNAPDSTTADHAFTIIEMLVVIAIILLLAGMMVPAAGIQRGMAVTRGGQMVYEKFNYARQIAITRNRNVEVRFYKTPATVGNTPGYRAFQFYTSDENGGNVVPLDKLNTLPEAVVISSVTGLSTIIDSPTRSGTQTQAGVGSASYAYKGFRFNGAGGTDLDPIGPGGSNASTWCITVSHETDPGTASTPPKNFCVIQIDPVSGNTRNFRP